MSLVRAVAVLSLCLPAVGLGQAWQKKVDDFRARAQAERKKLGLDRDVARLKAKYPTPEVTFSAAGSDSESCVALCPGKTGKVKLSGALAPKSLVVPLSDDVEVVTESLTTSGWEAMLRARPLAPPQRVGLTVITPVSAIQTYTPGAEVACLHGFTVTADKETITFRTDFPCGTDSITVEGEWKRGGAVVGRARYEVTRGDRTLQLTRALDDEDAARTSAAMSEVMSSPKMKSIEARQEALLKKAESCQGAGAAGFQACFQKVQVELEQLNAERDAYMAQEERKKLSPTFGCNSLSLQLAAGSVTGEAMGCSGKRMEEAVALKGTYTAP